MSYEEEDSYFAELRDTYGLEMYEIPMFRVTSVQGEATDWVDGMGNYYMCVIWPQGQHAGISESSYEELLKLLGKKDRKLNLKGENIHVVYQQDASFKAHPIDWFLTEFKPYLRNGQPVETYAFLDREKLFPPRDVQSEEVQILTGMFGRGDLENLIVFADDYFEQARKDVMEREEGPEKMVLLKVPEEQYGPVESALQEFAERHEEDSALDRDIQPFYGKKQMIQDTKSERYLKIVVWIFVILAISLSGILLILLKFVFEMDNLVNKYQFLSCLGMRNREIKKELRREMAPFWCAPCIVSVVSTALFTGITFRLRDFDAFAVHGYIRAAIWIWLLYWLVQAGCFVMIKQVLLRKIQEGQEV